MVLFLRDVLARSLFAKYLLDFVQLDHTLDTFGACREPHRDQRLRRLRAGA